MILGRFVLRAWTHYRRWCFNCLGECWAPNVPNRGANKSSSSFQPSPLLGSIMFALFFLLTARQRGRTCERAYNICMCAELYFFYIAVLRAWCFWSGISTLWVYTAAARGCAAKPLSLSLLLVCDFSSRKLLAFCAECARSLCFDHLPVCRDESILLFDGKRLSSA